MLTLIPFVPPILSLPVIVLFTLLLCFALTSVDCTALALVNWGTDNNGIDRVASRSVQETAAPCPARP